MKKTILLLLCFAAAFAAREDVLIQADKDFARVTAERGADGFLSFFADDATILPKSGAPLTGKTALGDAFRGAWSQPGYALAWTPLKAEMARGGDIGYTYGTYERKRLVDGKPVVETGKYVTVWKRQKDGGWKVILDMGN
jgi:ketosteroid isomerase-like protein